MKWLKRILFATGIVVALEVAAWVGIALLGKDAFRTLLDFYDPRAEVAAVTSSTGADGNLQKCSTFGGELFCITDKSNQSMAGKAANAARTAWEAGAGTSQRDDAESGTLKPDVARKNNQESVAGLSMNSPIHAGLVEKCATLDGELFCISERSEAAETAQRLPTETSEKCAFFEGESICIKESI